MFESYPAGAGVPAGRWETVRDPQGTIRIPAFQESPGPVLEVAPLDDTRGPRAQGAAVEGIDHSLAMRACAGDHEAYHLIFKRYSRPVHSFIYGLVGDRQQAEELVQETFVRAYLRLASVLDQDRLSTWLFGIARNVVREAVKRKYAERILDRQEETGSPEVEDGRPSPVEPLLADELRRAIHSALAGLPEDGRVVFVLKVLHQMRYREISGITGSSIGKLKTDLHRARLHMRRRLREYLGEGFPGLRGEA
jgi:RNA polymerase sigma-70 factor (ECF subfamily)